MDPRALPTPSTWQPSLDRWERDMRASGLSAASIQLRLKHVRQVARGLKVAPEQVSEDALMAWFARRAWRAETRRSYTISLRAYFRHAGFGVSPAAKLPKVKSSIPEPRPTPVDVARDAIATASPRVRLMLRLADEAGLRRGEICRVHVDDVVEDADGATLIVHGKGDRTRQVPISASLAASLRAHSGYVFPGAVDGHLSPGYVGKLCAGALRGPWTLHTLRHKAGTEINDALGGDILVTQRFLGHASVATTQRYVRPNMSKLRKAVQDRAA